MPAQGVDKLGEEVTTKLSQLMRRRIASMDVAMRNAIGLCSDVMQRYAGLIADGMPCLPCWFFPTVVAEVWSTGSVAWRGRSP